MTYRSKQYGWIIGTIKDVKANSFTLVSNERSRTFTKTIFFASDRHEVISSMEGRFRNVKVEKYKNGMLRYVASKNGMNGLSHMKKWRKNQEAIVEHSKYTGDHKITAGGKRGHAKMIRDGAATRFGVRNPKTSRDVETVMNKNFFK